MEGGKGGWTDWEGHHKVEEWGVERQVWGAEWRKGLSEEREEGSVIQSHSRLAFLVVALRPLPHLLTGLPPSIHVNAIIPSALCSHIRHITHLSPASPQNPLYCFIFYLLTFVCIRCLFLTTFHLFSDAPWAPLFCLDWIPADDGTHKASQMS